MLNKLKLMIVGILFLALAACSNSTSSSQNAGQSAGQSDSSENTITFAYLAGFTGDYAPWAQEESKGAQLAVEEINAAGGVLDGIKINLTTEDNESGVEGTIRGFSKLANTNVTAIVGPESDGIMAILEDAKNYEIPVIGNATGTPALDTTGGDYVYRVAPSDTLNGVIAADIILEEGYNEIAIMIENIESAQTSAETFKNSFIEKGGTVLTEVTFNPGQNSYQAELRRIADVNPEVVYIFGGIISGAVVLKQWYQQDYDWNWYLSGDMVSMDFVNAIGNEAAEGLKSIIGTQDRSTEQFKRFSERFQERFGVEPSPGMFTANSYDAIILLALAIEAGGEATGKAINDNLRRVSGPDGVEVSTFEEGVAELRKGNEINYQGASGPVDFNEYGNVSAAFVLTNIKDGVIIQEKVFVPELE